MRGQKRHADISAPREYALTQQHKHLKEMKKITGLSREPLFPLLLRIITAVWWCPFRFIRSI